MRNHSKFHSHDDGWQNCSAFIWWNAIQQQKEWLSTTLWWVKQARHKKIYTVWLHLHKASQVALVVKNPPVNAGDIREVASIPGSGRSPEEGNSNPHLVAQMVKNLPAIRDTWVWSLGWEDPLEKEMATHSSILAWRIPWREQPGGLQSIGSQRVGHRTQRTDRNNWWWYDSGQWVPIYEVVCPEGGTRGFSGVTWVIVTWIFTFFKGHKTAHLRSMSLNE